MAWRGSHAAPIQPGIGGPGWYDRAGAKRRGWERSRPCAHGEKKISQCWKISALERSS